MNIQLPEDLHEELRLAKARRDTSQKEIMIEALEKELGVGGEGE